MKMRRNPASAPCAPRHAATSSAAKAPPGRPPVVAWWQITATSHRVASVAPELMPPAAPGDTWRLVALVKVPAKISGALHVGRPARVSPAPVIPGLSAARPLPSTSAAFLVRAPAQGVAMLVLRAATADDLLELYATWDDHRAAELHESLRPPPPPDIQDQPSEGGGAPASAPPPLGDAV